MRSILKRRSLASIAAAVSKFHRDISLHPVVLPRSYIVHRLLDTDLGISLDDLLGCLDRLVAAFFAVRVRVADCVGCFGRHSAPAKCALQEMVFERRGVVLR